MTKTLSHSLKVKDYRFIFLVLLLIVLPSLEAPKNLFALLYIISWGFIGYREKNWGGRWRLLDSLLAFFLLGNIAVSLNASFVLDWPVSSINDVTRYLLIVWVLSRHILTKNQIVFLYWTVILSTALSLVYTLFLCPGGGVCIELNSVGHVNHTAIFLIITYSIALSLLITNFLSLLNYQKVLLVVSILLFAYGIIETNSRAASGFLVLVTLFSLIYSFIKFKSWYIRILMIFGLLIGSLIVLHNPPPVIDKFKASDSIFSDFERKKIRNFSFYAFKTYPILGVGFGNFNKLGHTDIKHKVIQELGSYKKEDFAPYAHSHNIYYNFLVSGGIVMFVAFISFISKVVMSTWNLGKVNNRKELRQEDKELVIEYRDESMIIISSVFVVLIVLGIGFVNTTLSQEHAILSMFVMGILLSKDREINER